MDSPAAEVLVPLIFFATSFGIIYIVVTSRHRQRMAMIDKGMDPGSFKMKDVPLRTLRNGMVMVAVGLGLFLGNLWERHMPMRNIDGEITDSPMPYFVMVLLCVGVALVAHHFIARNKGGEA